MKNQIREGVSPVSSSGAVTHTPGPWEVCPGVYDTNPETATEFPHGPEVVAGDDTVAWCSLYGEADARLIAAAPDLFEAIKPLVFSDIYNAPHGVASSDWNKAILAARAAFTKAIRSTDAKS